MNLSKRLEKEKSSKANVKDSEAGTDKAKMSQVIQQNNELKKQVSRLEGKISNQKNAEDLAKQSTPLNIVQAERLKKDFMESNKKLNHYMKKVADLEKKLESGEGHANQSSQKANLGQAMEIEKKLFAYESKIKELEKEVGQNQSNEVLGRLSQSQEENKKLKEELLNQKRKSSELENKLHSINKSMGNDQGKGDNPAVQNIVSPAKVKRLEASNKKLSQDLAKAGGLVSESKKDLNKLKSETVGLKNQLEAAKKELEKLKARDQNKKKAA